ncbi:methyl-accepting chemotaxis protein [Schwartzia sp. (in: firmicutes)]
MGFFQNIRVAFKILTLAVIALIALAVVGYGGYSTFQDAQKKIDVMYNQRLKNGYNAGQMKYFMRDMQSRAALSMSATTPERFADLKKDMDEVDKNYLATWEDYKTRVAPGSNMDSIEEMKTVWLKFSGTMREILALNEKGDREGAQKLYSTKGSQDTTAMRKVLEAKQTAVMTNSEKMYQENIAKSEAASRNMIIQCVVALVVLVLASIFISREITNPLDEIMANCKKLSDGDFRDSGMSAERRDEFGDMEQSFIAMRQNLNKLMKQIHSSSDQIAASSEELTASSSQSAQASEQSAQAVTRAAGAVAQQQVGIASSTESIQQVSQAIESLRQEAQKIADQSSAAFDKATAGSNAIISAVDQIKSVEKTVGESAGIVDKLGERSQEIGTIVETISGIAGQTNLLALNAAIEAARAGEHGRGFAVVAEEVRKLAEQSQTAAQQIAELIGSIQNDTTSAVSSMREGTKAVSVGAQAVEGLRATFDEIRDNVDMVTGEVSEMSSSIQGVATDTQNISNQIAEIDQQGTKVSDEMQNVSAIAEEQSASAGEIASASGSLSELAQDLQNSLQRFRF